MIQKEKTTRNPHPTSHIRNMLLSLYRFALCRHLLLSLSLSFLFVYIFKLLHVNGIFLPFFLPFENQHKKLVSSSAFLSNFPPPHSMQIYIYLEYLIMDTAGGSWEREMALNDSLMQNAHELLLYRWMIDHFSFYNNSPLPNGANWSIAQTHIHTTAGKLPMLPRLVMYLVMMMGDDTFLTCNKMNNNKTFPPTNTHSPTPQINNPEVRRVGLYFGWRVISLILGSTNFFVPGFLHLREWSTTPHEKHMSTT